ncbi:MAG: ABC transporter permease [Bacillota bacterium]|jgi:putative hydroxymethylpyrimidine transport system permease protein
MSKPYLRKLMPVILPAILLLLWEATVRLGELPLYLLPAPSQILRALLDNHQVILPHALITLGEAALGIVIATGLAALLGIAMDAWPTFRQAVYPLMVVSQSVPIIVLAPLFIIYFGFGLAPKVITVVLMCFFPIAVNLADGFGQVSHRLVDLLRTMGATRWDIYRIIKLPAAAPAFFSGLRVAATYSIMGAVVGEWLGGSGGLGYYMLRVKNAYMLDRVFAIVLLIIVLSLLCNAVVRAVEYLLTPWTRSRSATPIKEGDNT